MSISFLLHCAKMAAAAPGITTVSRQKEKVLAYVTYTYSSFQKIETLPPSATAAACSVLTSQKWPTSAVRDVERVSTPYIMNRQGRRGLGTPAPLENLVNYFNRDEKTMCGEQLAQATQARKPAQGTPAGHRLAPPRPTTGPPPAVLFNLSAWLSALWPSTLPAVKEA